MNDAPTQPVSLHALSATTGEIIPDPLAVDRQLRGRALARAEIDLWLADHQAATRHGTASVTMEIAFQLRQELRDLEVIHAGTLEERMEALAHALADFDTPSHRMAGKYIEMAMLLMEPG